MDLNTIQFDYVAFVCPWCEASLKFRYNYANTYHIVNKSFDHRDISTVHFEKKTRRMKLLNGIIEFWIFVIVIMSAAAVYLNDFSNSGTSVYQGSSSGMRHQWPGVDAMNN